MSVDFSPAVRRADSRPEAPHLAVGQEAATSEGHLRGMPGFVSRISSFFRRRRLERFRRVFPPAACRTVVDFGGSTYHWERLDYPGEVTIVNRDAEELRQTEATPRRVYRFVVADATSTGLGDRSADLAFSNSVIEHVGDLADQRRFASEMLRVGRGVWCQTPNRRFFFETHLMAAFVHYLPLEWQVRLVRNFTLWGWMHRPTRDQARAYLAITRLLTRREMAELFPGCEILTERFFGLAKSFIALRRPEPEPR